MMSYAMTNRVASQRQAVLRARARTLVERRKFRDALSGARQTWNQVHRRKLGEGTLPEPTPDVESRWRWAWAGISDDSQDWADLVDRLCRDWFPGFAVGLRHPAWPWLAACLVASEKAARPSDWIEVEAPKPRFHHPYSEALEHAITRVILSGDASTLRQEFLDAQALKFAWPFVPYVDDTPAGRLRRAQAMRSQGATLRDIADALGVSQRQVGRWKLDPAGSPLSPGALVGANRPSRVSAANGGTQAGVDSGAP
jgi:hypothetical protein